MRAPDQGFGRLDKTPSGLVRPLHQPPDAVLGGLRQPRKLWSESDDTFGRQLSAGVAAVNPGVGGPGQAFKARFIAQPRCRQTQRAQQVGLQLDAASGQGEQLLHLRQRSQGRGRGHHRIARSQRTQVGVCLEAMHLHGVGQPLVHPAAGLRHPGHDLGAASPGTAGKGQPQLARQGMARQHAQMP